MNQLLFPAFRFGIDDPAFAERLTDLGVGGFCLFGGEPAEIRALTSRLQARAKTPLLFCADYEDGVGSQVVGATLFPPNMGAAATGDPAWAAEKARISAAESKALGVHWILAPVLDLATNPSNPIVNVRSFGSNPAEVSRFGHAAMQAYRAAGVLNCAKHFPGHGETAEDSHIQLPILGSSIEQLKSRELAPFRALLPLTDALMSAHLHVSALSQTEEPFSLSKDALAQLARRELGFGGVVVTDSLAMNAVSAYTPEDAAVAALRAGNDVLLMPPDPQKLAYSWQGKIEADPELKANAEAALARLGALKAKLKTAGPEGELSIVGASEHLKKAAQMAEASLSWSRVERVLKPSKIRYMEPEADTPDDWIGKIFVEELRSFGFEVEPASNGSEGALIAGCGLGPKAYAGRVGYFEEEIAKYKEALGPAKDAVVVSYGSPYVFEQFDGSSAGLCAFSASDASQRAAARAIAGKIQAKGRLPVDIKT